MNQFSFERLEVWSESRHLAKLVYKLTGKFPDEEKFGIANQMRRAVISVSSNIVEGSYRKSPRDKINFMNFAFSSLMELLSQVIISHDMEYISKEEFQSLRDSIESISNKLSSLTNYFKKLESGNRNNDITK
ncbi:MAG: four helix bundle protein [Bacteroidales bacterium]